jgi:hypothetical protein
MPVNNQPPIGMITVKVTAPMISSVTAEVRITFFGHSIDPRGNIIGVLIAAILGAWVERQVRRVMPAPPSQTDCH